MIDAISALIQTTNLPLLLNLMISSGLGFCGFFFAFSIKKRGIKSKWFTTLRYILTLLSVSALSNVYSLAILGYKIVQPSELLLNTSVFILMVWAIAYYVKNIVGSGTSLTQEKVLKFIEKEHTTTGIQQ
jgi:hypothetical protein